MRLKKNIKLGKVKIQKYFYLIFLFLIFSFKSFASDLMFVEIKILDKVSSKTSQLSLNIEQETKFENLIIKILKCKNSEFDDNPEITAYMQVQDITLKNNDKVFVFNGWTFSSSPSISLFDHPVYDIWLIKCY
ncbi:MAG: DUF2155 domain-containing protein [Pelagibacterales bacterium]|nr:DUF2155 domain-containing protein [Pelagibacterales bacterium]